MLKNLEKFLNLKISQKTFLVFNCRAGCRLSFLVVHNCRRYSTINVFQVEKMNKKYIQFKVLSMNKKIE